MSDFLTKLCSLFNHRCTFTTEQATPVYRYTRRFRNFGNHVSELKRTVVAYRLYCQCGADRQVDAVK